MERTDTPVLLLTVREAARLLSVSSKTLRRLVAEGKVRATTIGARHRIPMAEVERLASPKPKRKSGPEDEVAKLRALRAARQTTFR